MFKKKKTKVVAYATGRIIDISKVEDPVFSKKMMGDGFAIDVTGDSIVSPIDGTIEMIFPTKHALGLKMDNGTEILIHVGMDTVNLEGQGFTSFVEKGQRVQAGDLLLKLDRTFFDQNNISLVTPLVITSGELIKGIQTEVSVQAGHPIEWRIK